MKYPAFELRNDLDKFTVVDATPPDDDLATRMEALAGHRKAGDVLKDSVSTLRGMIDPAMLVLCQRARSGNSEALWHFASILRECCEALSHITRENPKALAPLARWVNRWPMMRSTHPHLRDPDEWLNEMELGRAFPIQIDQHSKWKADHASDVAIQLFNYLNKQREENIFFILKGGKKVRAQKCLPKFNQDTASTWWQYAEHCLITSYPKPEKHWKLIQIATTKSRKFPSQKREQILTKIKARFLHMASCQS